MAFTEGTNALPDFGSGIKAGGIPEGTSTGSNLWLPRSMAAGDGLAPKYIPGFGWYVFDGTNLQRARQMDPAGSAQTVGVPAAGMHLWHAASDIRVARSFGGVADGNTGAGSLSTGLLNYDGSTYQKSRSGSAANMAAATQSWATIVSPPGEWTELHFPAAATIATCSRIVGGAGVRHVCTGIIATVATGATAQTPLAVFLRDGASGGTAKLVAVVAAPANSVGKIVMTGLHIVGTANTAMTLEFGAAGVAGSNQAVTLTGYSVV